MTIVAYKTLLKDQAGNELDTNQRREHIIQIEVPIFHEDGDGVDVFIDENYSTSESIRLTDLGMTLMRLSYEFDIDSDSKRGIFNRIIDDNRIANRDGELMFDCPVTELYASVLHFAQVIAKISNMRAYRREIQQSDFYDVFASIVTEKLADFAPVKDFIPLSGRPELEVDFCLTVGAHPLFVWGIKGPSKAKLVAIACLTYQKELIPYRSVVAYEDFDLFPKKERTILTNVADKQFTSLDNFAQNSHEYMSRLAA